MTPASSIDLQWEPHGFSAIDGRFQLYNNAICAHGRCAVPVAGGRRTTGWTVIDRNHCPGQARSYGVPVCGIDGALSLREWVARRLAREAKLIFD